MIQRNFSRRVALRYGTKAEGTLKAARGKALVLLAVRADGGSNGTYSIAFFLKGGRLPTEWVKPLSVPRVETRPGAPSAGAFKRVGGCGPGGVEWGVPGRRAPTSLSSNVISRGLSRIKG